MILLALLLVPLGVLCWVRLRYVVVTVEGRSMEPTLRDGDRLVVRRTRGRSVRRGQIVVYRDDLSEISHLGDLGAEVPAIAEIPEGISLWVVKRAVAVGGDPSSIAGRDGEPVPAGYLVVLGDAPDHSFDSRDFGYLRAERVMGVMVRRMG